MADDENLLSEKNKERCIEEFDQLMPIRVPKNPKSLGSVLIPIIELDNGQGPGLLYTKRSSKLSSHAREVCFPGGKKVGWKLFAQLFGMIIFYLVQRDTSNRVLNHWPRNPSNELICTYPPIPRALWCILVIFIPVFYLKDNFDTSLIIFKFLNAKFAL